MEKIHTITSAVVPIKLDHVDTDQIVPARFLKATSREGFGQALFHDWRFDKEGQVKLQFPLNNPTYAGQILLTGENFGCGSSREHAAWAIADYGFKALIASSFADIFKQNALNNGLLPVELPKLDINFLFSLIDKQPDIEFKIDLPKQRIEVPTAGWGADFHINPYKKSCLLNGYDNIDYLLSIQQDILAFEEKRYGTN
ncbi:MAG: 3-isopropylmalate dehydratase small subunit [Bacteroidota bacterium]